MVGWVTTACLGLAVAGLAVRRVLAESGSPRFLLALPEHLPRKLAERHTPTTAG